MSVGNNIRFVRKNKKMTQQELADALGVSHQTVSSWEIDRTQPDIGTVERIAKILDCSVQDIVYSPLTSSDDVADFIKANPEYVPAIEILIAQPKTQLRRIEKFLEFLCKKEGVEDGEN